MPALPRSTAPSAITGAQTVPQLFGIGERIGGSAEIERWLQERWGAAR